MSFEVRTIAVFDRNMKRLARKYRSLKKDLAQLAVSLSADPKQGTPIGGGCYKIRLSVGSKGKGKSSGTRVITYVAMVQRSVYLLTIYDKSDQEEHLQAGVDVAAKDDPLSSPHNGLTKDP